METDLDQLFVRCSHVIGELLVFVSPGSVMIVEDPNDRGYYAIRRVFLNAIVENSVLAR